MNAKYPFFIARPVFNFILIVVLMFGQVGQVFASSSFIYVKADATGANNGTSWVDAYTELQSALSAATNGNQIWVAAGTYYPTSGPDRTATFTLQNDIAIYGGFTGTETLLVERDPSINVTILSGDIGILGDTSDNSYHVITGGGTNNTAVLDGFTVTAGNANGTTNPNFRGGGMYNNNSSPSLRNMAFSGNSASNSGGGIFNNSSNPVLTNVIFSNNTSAREGGGMGNENSGPSLTNVAFITNTASNYGGGMFNAGSAIPVLMNVTFRGNTATTFGGGMYNLVNNASLTNVTFSENTATEGGGMFNDDSSPSLTNVTFSGNTATGNAGGAIWNYSGDSDPIIKNSIFWGNSTEFDTADGNPVISDSIVAGGCPAGGVCTNVIDADPLLDTLADNGGFTQTMSLGAGSPAIDAGDNASCATTDQRGVARPQGPHCDIGAYESPDTTIPVVLSIVRANLDPTNAPIVNFTVTFSEPVMGVNLSTAFALTTTGVTGAYLSNISGSGATYTVSVGTGSGSGTIRLDVVDYDSIVDTSSNPLGGVGAGNGNFTSGESYTILTQSGPTFTVNTAADSNGTCDIAPGDCSLREAINAANALAGTDTIVFDADYIITLAGSQLPVITSTMIITGNGESKTILQANSAQNTATYRLLEVSGTGNLTLNGLTIRHGFCNGSCPTVGSLGGGILINNGMLTLNNITVTGNSASTFAGGIYNIGGTLTLNASTVSANSAGSGGGGIINLVGTITLNNSTVSGNSATNTGGGIYNNGGTLTIQNDSLIGGPGSANTADVGGGIYNNGTTTIDASTVSANTAQYGGGIYTNENLNIQNGSIIGGASAGNSATQDGGGVYVNHYFTGATTIDASTIIGNTATNGGGIYNTIGGLTLTDATVSGNESRNTGGGIYNVGTSTLNYSTVANNTSDSDNNFSGSGGGIFNQGTVNLKSSIVAGNQNGISGTTNATADCSGAITSHGYNLTGNGTGCSFSSISDVRVAPANVFTTVLGALADNGGPTQTHALLTDSPAINRILYGTNGCGAPFNFDQRGITRPQGLHCDIGAFELVDASDPTVVSIVRTGPDPIKATSVDFTVTFSEPVNGVDANDFALTATGIVGASISSISAMGPIYTVSVDTGSGSGTIHLDVVDDDSIIDSASNPLGGIGAGNGNFTSGQRYTIFTSQAGPNFIVNTSADSNGACDTAPGDCSLREAINAANARAGTDTITFDADYTITLVGNQLPVITSTIIITGNGEAHTILQANANPNTVNYRVLEVGGTGNLTLNNATVQNGYSEGYGGGLFINGGTASLNDATVSDNSASNGGGGIFAVNSIVLLTDSTISNNSGPYGGGINNNGGTFTLITSTVSDNSATTFGGGIINNSGALILTKSTVNNNLASSGGGGVYNAGTMVLNESTINNNSATYGGGGIWNYSMLTLNNSTVKNNSTSYTGGGIYVQAGRATLNASTINSNTAQGGGGVYNDGSLNLKNSTISSNSAVSGGGGVMHNSGTTTLQYSTITNNLSNSVNSPFGNGPGGGISKNSGTVNLQNSVVIGNKMGTTGISNTSADCSGAMTSLGYNLTGSGTGCTLNAIGDLTANPMTVSFDVLGPLADNGGATQTHTLIPGPGNPALNAIPGGINDCGTAPFDQDQRGEPRPFSVNGNCDIGAFESQFINSAPVITEGGSINITMSEDGSPTAFDLTLHATDNDGDTLTWSIGNPARHGTATASGTGLSKIIGYSPSADYNGSDSFDMQVSDGNGEMDTITVTVTINPINDAPSFTAVNPPSILEDSGTQMVTSWATFSAGPANESGQTVNSYVVSSVSSPGLFSEQPTVAPNGTLTYRPANNANGTSTFTVRVQDSGGTANGGINFSASQTFTITVTAVNDHPSITKGPDQTVNEDAGPQTVPGWATNISAGPPDESWQTVTLSITGDIGPYNTALFAVQPTVNATNGDLTYTPAPNANGSTTIAVIPSDDGGGANGGIPLGPKYIFVITITPVNDPPVITEGDSVNVTMSEDSSPTAFDLTLNAADVEGNTLTWSISTTASHGTASASGTGSSKSIVFTPSPDYYGTDSFEVRVSDGNLADHITVNVTINPVNDVPIITEGASVNVTMSQNGSPTPFASTLHATDPDGNPLTWSVSAPASHGTATASGTGLTKIIGYTPQTNYNGTDSFTVQVSDGNGGTDTITVNVTITPVNAVPSLDAIDPASARMGDTDSDLDITGANFASNAIVKWRNISTNTTTNLVTTYVSSTELSAVVPSALLASTGTFEVSVFNPAPGGGTSISLPFFVTQTAASIISSDTATSTNPVGTAVASTGGSGAGTPGSITATGTGTGTVTVTIYDSNPRSASPFRVSGKYFDVYVAQGSNFSSVQIVACNMTAFSSVKWLDSNNKWKVVNPQSYSNGCVTMNLSNTSSPKISQLTGTIFGVEESPVKNIVLIDSQGGGLEGATAQYYVNGWRNIPGTTDTDGVLSYEGLGLSGNITFRITYANASVQKQQNVTNNPEVAFQTQLVSMQLLASNGTTELNGDAQYYSNGWLTFGNGSTTTSMELLPLNYTFRVSYGGASVQKQQNIANEPAVIFQTKSVSMQLLASNGTTELAGTSEYYANGWKTFGGGSTSTTMELLPVNYTFRISYGGASIQKQQDVNTNAAVVFQTKSASMQLLASNGTTELAGTSEYYANGWKTFGNGSTTTTMELLPVNYTFRVSYGGASVQKQQDMNTNPLVVFQTKLVTMKLLASNGTTELVGTSEYYANGWKTFGNGTTTTTMELLPVNYTFRVSYGGSNVQKQQDANANQLVVFQTGQVHSTSAAATQYYANGWKIFVQNMELLPGGYPFKFNDGTLQTTYPLIAGTINNIH